MTMLRMQPKQGTTWVWLAGSLALLIWASFLTARVNENGRMISTLLAATRANEGSTQASALAAGGGQAAQQAAAPRAVKPIPPLPNRNALPALLQAEGMTSGAELGVLVGDFAEFHLSHWPACKRYYLVDLWAPQENYKDLANDAGKEDQEQRFQQTQKRLAPWKDKTTFLRTFTTEAAKQVPDGSLDYVYVDARHDYCGVMDDLQAWYPKIRSGGIFAGHDYIDARHQLLKDTNQVHWGAVKGAVDDFAAAQGLTVSATLDGAWATWVARKP